MSHVPRGLAIETRYCDYSARPVMSERIFMRNYQSR